MITGGASGIGLALATKCASYGMNVIIVDNNGANLVSAKEAIVGRVTTVEIDVSKIEEFEKVKSVVSEKVGGEFDSDSCFGGLARLLKEVLGGDFYRELIYQFPSEDVMTLCFDSN